MIRPITLLRGAAIVTIAALIGWIIASALQESLMDGLRRIGSRRWGVTTLIDLYAGLAFVALWIALLERRPSRYIPWMVALALLGNLATATFLGVRAFRCRTVREAILGIRGA